MSECIRCGCEILGDETEKADFYPWCDYCDEKLDEQDNEKDER